MRLIKVSKNGKMITAQKLLGRAENAKQKPTMEEAGGLIFLPKISGIFNRYSFMLGNGF